MATVSTPVHAYVASPVPTTAMGQSSNLTVALSVAGFEAWVPIQGHQPNTANISAGLEIYAYRSTDGGSTYETVASVSTSIARNPNATDQKSIRLESGYWLLRIISGGNVAATFSCAVNTFDVLTAIVNN